MEPRYDRSVVSDAFDLYGEREWERHERSPFARVSLHLHRRYLERFIQPGNRVLEVGSGAGRFTVELARLGAHVWVTDISPGQLELHMRHLAENGLEEAVERREIVDLLDLGSIDRGPFDAVVCYGGPLSFVMDEADVGLEGLLEAARPGGYVLIGVMSRLGSLRTYLSTAEEEIRAYGVEEMDRVVSTGELPVHHSSLGAPMHLYTWAELARLFSRHGCEVVAASAANFVSIGNDELCERWLAQEPELWERLLAWEELACAQPGALDAGTHIIAVVRRE